MQITATLHGLLQASSAEEKQVSKIVLVMSDNSIEEVTNAYNDELQDRVDNLYRSEWEQGFIDTVIAYDQSGDRMGAMTADEFFGERLGF